jgi:hypothetical protein
LDFAAFFFSLVESLKSSGLIRKEGVLMKKQTKQYDKGVKERQGEQQSIQEHSNGKDMQPVPQPKDYEDIEY